MAELPRRRRARSCPSPPTETKECESGDRTGWRVLDTTTPHREHRPRDGQRQVGTARTGNGQPAGWEPPPGRGTLSAMTTATAELPLPAGQAVIGRLFAKLGLSPDEDQHRRVLATLAHLRS